MIRGDAHRTSEDEILGRKNDGTRSHKHDKQDEVLRRDERNDRWFRQMCEAYRYDRTRSTEEGKDKTRKDKRKKEIE